MCVCVRVLVRFVIISCIVKVYLGTCLSTTSMLKLDGKTFHVQTSFLLKSPLSTLFLRHFCLAVLTTSFNPEFFITAS